MATTKQQSNKPNSSIAAKSKPAGKQGSPKGSLDTAKSSAKSTSNKGNGPSGENL